MSFLAHELRIGQLFDFEKFMHGKWRKSTTNLQQTNVYFLFLVWINNLSRLVSRKWPAKLENTSPLNNKLMKWNEQTDSKKFHSHLFAFVVCCLLNIFLIQPKWSSFVFAYRILCAAASPWCAVLCSVVLFPKLEHSIWSECIELNRNRNQMCLLLAKNVHKLDRFLSRCWWYSTFESCQSCHSSFSQLIQTIWFVVYFIARFINVLSFLHCSVLLHCFLCLYFFFFAEIRKNFCNNTRTNEK